MICGKSGTCRTGAETEAWYGVVLSTGVQDVDISLEQNVMVAPAH